MALAHSPKNSICFAGQALSDIEKAAHIKHLYKSTETIGHIYSTYTWKHLGIRCLSLQGIHCLRGIIRISLRWKIIAEEN